MEPILEVKQLTMDFGGLRALDKVDLDIRQGEIVALIGPNGAGKTTFFNCITGIYTPTGGDIEALSKAGKRQRINGIKPNLVTEIGLARTFQNIRLFQNMTVLENVMIGCHCRMKAGILGAVAGILGTIQAAEVLKLVLGIGDALVGRLVLCNTLDMSFRELRFARRADCPICGDAPTITGLIDYQEFCSLRATGVPEEALP